MIRGLPERYKKLDVRYDGKPVKNFGITILGFWNNGRETIRKGDFPDNSALKIQMPEADSLLDVQVEWQSTSGNNVVVHPRGDSAAVEFDYLDHKQGDS